MNDRNKHKVTGQMNHQTADPKTNASAFLFFPNAHFLKQLPTHIAHIAKAPQANATTKAFAKSAILQTLKISLL